MVDLKCNIDRDKLEKLISAFINPNFDSEPVKPDLDFIKMRLKEDGLSNIEIYKVIKGLDNYEENVEAYGVMLNWGKNKREAIRNYSEHFNGCFNCGDVYSDFLKEAVKHQHGSELGESELKRGLRLTHEDYLGCCEIKRIGFEFKLDCFLGENNGK
jgi:hypothetical protein